MTKEVIVQIKSMQALQEGVDPEPLCIITMGKYSCVNHNHVLVYDEMMSDDVKDVTTNYVKIKEDVYEVKKKGLANTQMIFEKGKKTFTEYETPYGTMFLGITTIDQSCQLTDDSIRILISYALEINGGLVGDCRIEITAKTKNKEALLS